MDATKDFAVDETSFCVEKLLSLIKLGSDYDGQLVHLEEIPAREGAFLDPIEPLPEASLAIGPVNSFNRQYAIGLACKIFCAVAGPMPLSWLMLDCCPGALLRLLR